MEDKCFWYRPFGREKFNPVLSLFPQREQEQFLEMKALKGALRVERTVKGYNRSFEGVKDSIQTITGYVFS